MTTASPRPSGSSAPGTIHTARIWINSFIPRDVDGAVVVPGTGPHAGKTMMPTPGPINAWFLTDQRDFSDGADAHSRMHSEITLDLVEFTLAGEFHRCDATIQVDENTGEELCHEIPDRSDMRFDEVAFDPAAGRVSALLHGSSKNACLKIGPVKITPSLDYDGTITLTLDSARTSARAAFEGRIETYPAFEMYVSLNDGAPQVVFREPVVAGHSPLVLTGPPGRPLDVAVTARL